MKKEITVSYKKSASLLKTHKKAGWVCRVILPASQELKLEASKKPRFNHVIGVKKSPKKPRKFKESYFFSPGKQILPITNISDFGFDGLFYVQFSRGGLIYRCRNNFIFVHYIYGNQREKFALLSEIKEKYPDTTLVVYVFRETAFIRKLLRKGFIRKSKNYQEFLLLAPFDTTEDI